MKKIVIALFLSIILILVLNINVKNVNAEYITNDYFLNNDLYLFSHDVSISNLNFENGYISKKTISYQDIEQNTNNVFYSWYRNLGIDLIYQYQEGGGEDEYFYFAIKLDNVAATTFQIAYSVGSPFDIELVLMFNDGTFKQWTGGINGYRSMIIPEDDKISTYFLWDVYFPDYVCNFKTLTNQTSYDLGYEYGHSVGFDDGYDVGTESGYQHGYHDGLIDGALQEGYSTTLNFNQLFESDDPLITTQNGNVYSWANVIVGNKYLLVVQPDVMQTNESLQLWESQGRTNVWGNSDPNIVSLGQIYSSSSVYYRIITITTYNYFQVRSTNLKTTSGKTWQPMLFDLTQIYGAGNEPTNYQTFLDNFPSTYYPYTTSEIINVNYDVGFNNGYIDGYWDGYDTAETHVILADGWIRTIFHGIGDFLAIQILPGVTIGLLIGIPLIISVAWFIIRTFRGGGN